MPMPMPIPIPIPIPCLRPRVREVRPNDVARHRALQPRSGAAGRRRRIPRGHRGLQPGARDFLL